jgi:hypothetical protein
MSMTLAISRLGAAVALATILAATAPPGAFAGPAADKAAEAEALLADGQTAEAIAAFEAAADEFWGALPFHLKTGLFADSVTAYGQYQARPAASFRNGETATIYIEPAGYGFTMAGGWYRVAFSTTMQIRTPGGLILGESDDFGRIDWRGRTKNREVPLTISVALPDLKPGDYELELGLTDDVTGEAESLTLPFAIVE